MSGPDELVDSPAFIRQRRNLILASLVLAFAQGAHLTIHRLNVFGVEGTIDAPLSVTPFLAVLWIYFIWRYWQAFSSVDKVPTRKCYRQVKKVLLERIAVQRALIPYRNNQPSLLAGERQAWMPRDEEKSTSEGATVVVIVNIVEDSNPKERIQKNIEINFSRAEMYLIRGRAVLHLVITADEFSEYYLPFLIATAPVMVRLWQSYSR